MTYGVIITITLLVYDTVIPKRDTLEVKFGLAISGLTLLFLSLTAFSDPGIFPKHTRPKVRKYPSLTHSLAPCSPHLLPPSQTHLLTYSLARVFSGPELELLGAGAVFPATERDLLPRVQASHRKLRPLLPLVRHRHRPQELEVLPLLCVVSDPHHDLRHSPAGPGVEFPRELRLIDNHVLLQRLPGSAPRLLVLFT